MEELHRRQTSSVLAHLPVDTSWTFDPLQIVPTILLGGAVRASGAHAARRGTPMCRPGASLPSRPGSRCSWSRSSSPDRMRSAKQLFSFHMLQHVLLGDLAPLALLAGLTGPILRPALAPTSHRLRFLANPIVALPLWAVNLYVWHLPFLYEAAVRHDIVHALEHLCFFTGRRDHVAARPRDAARAGVVRHRREDRLHRSRARWSRRCSGTSSSGPGAVFYPAVYVHRQQPLGALTAPGSGLRGRGDDDRGLDRHARRARVALPAHGAARASCGSACSSAASIRGPCSAAVRYGEREELARRR